MDTKAIDPLRPALGTQGIWHAGTGPVFTLLGTVIQEEAIGCYRRLGLHDDGMCFL